MPVNRTPRAPTAGSHRRGREAGKRSVCDGPASLEIATASVCLSLALMVWPPLSLRILIQDNFRARACATIKQKKQAQGERHEH